MILLVICASLVIYRIINADPKPEPRNEGRIMELIALCDKMERKATINPVCIKGIEGVVYAYENNLITSQEYENTVNTFLDNMEVD